MAEFVADVLMWCWCWLAYQLVLALPVGRTGGHIDRFWLWLLPFAGFYAYHDARWMTWRWSGKPR